MTSDDPVWGRPDARPGNEPAEAEPAGAEPAPADGPGPAPSGYGQYQPGRYGPYGDDDAAAGSGRSGPPVPTYGQQVPPQPVGATYGSGAPTYGQPSYGQPAYGSAPAYGQYGSPVIVPPPRGFGGAARPGIIPLRPLSVGEVLDGAFRAIRANPKVMFGLSLLVLGISSVIQGLVLWFFLDQTIPLLEDPMLASTATPEEILGLGVGSMVALLVASVAILLATILLTGILIVSVSQSVLGRVVTVSEVWAQSKGRMWALLGLTFLLGLGGTVLFVGGTFVAAFLLAAVATALGDAGPAVALLLGLAIFGVAMLVVFWVAIRLSLAAPAVVLERAGVGTAMRRSWALTKGHFWRIFGILLLSSIIVSVITYALTLIPSIAVGFAATNPDAMVGWTVALTVLSALISAVTTPFLAAVLALVYIDVRMRKEGLDVELARAAAR